MQGSRVSLLGILQSSAVLQQVLPEVRLKALVHTIAAADTNERARDVLIENLVGSPYIPNEKKNDLAELALTERWAELRAALQCQNAEEGDIATSLDTFRDMVVAIFSRSKKMAQLSPERRQILGAAIHGQRSIEELKAFALTTLESSQVFDEPSRNRVANDIFDDRYDLLLLPDSFDCEEKTRVHSDPTDSEIAAECPVCLGDNTADTLLPCQHMFCRSCVTQWVRRHQNCPMCRAHVEHLPPRSATAPVVDM